LNFSTSAYLRVELSDIPSDVVSCRASSTDPSQGTAAADVMYFTPAEPQPKELRLLGTVDIVDDGNTTFGVRVTCTAKDSLWGVAEAKATAPTADVPFPHVLSLIPTAALYAGSQVTLQGAHFGLYDDYEVIVGGIRVNGAGIYRTVLVNETAGLLFSVTFAKVNAYVLRLSWSAHCGWCNVFCRLCCRVAITSSLLIAVASPARFHLQGSDAAHWEQNHTQALRSFVTAASDPAANQSISRRAKGGKGRGTGSTIGIGNTGAMYVTARFGDFRSVECKAPTSRVGCASHSLSQQCTMPTRCSALVACWARGIVDVWLAHPCEQRTPLAWYHHCG
jgi:hypothetical protein